MAKKGPLNIYYNGENLTVLQISKRTGCTCQGIRERIGKGLSVNDILSKDALRIVHGHARKGLRTSTYYIWASMIKRCTNPKEKHFHNYGGRGI